MSTGAAIEISGLVKTYGDKRVLDGVELSVPAGSVFGFLGPNGAGKSTTLNILTGLVAADSGAVRLLGRDLRPGGDDLRAEIGYLPDVPAFYGWMTAPEWMHFSGELFGLDRATIAARAEALLDLAGLRGVDARIGGYSRGMRQRLGLAQALINAPKLLLLDEPTSALDPLGRKEMLEMIATLGGRTTIFFSSHTLADVERVCDRVAILDRGRVVAQAETSELRARIGSRQIGLTLGSAAEAAALAADLAAAPWAVKIEHEGVTLTVTANDLAAAERAIPAAVAARGFALARMESGEASLEEVFVALVGAPRS